MKNENQFGHILRMSDASSYDVICKKCGSTDERGSDALRKQCPISTEQYLSTKNQKELN